MNFIDRTGHIFTLTSYDNYPIGYEYQETPYIFWFDSENSSKLSVNNYYFKPIRIVTRVKEYSKVNIEIRVENSNIFRIIDSDIIENKLLSADTINDNIEIFENEISNSTLISYTEDISKDDFKGALVDESDEDNPIEMGTETYYINAVSKREYKGDIYKPSDLIGFTYLGTDNEYHVIEGDEEILLGKVEIGAIHKYVILDTATREIQVTDENRDHLTDIYVKSDLYLINTFYAVVNSPEAGVWSTNILIHVDEEWCPVTVSAEIVDECEELIINGTNFGVSLPKEITRAIYSSNYAIDIADEKVYYQKLKEYMMNYMTLKGESGNYRSAINSLKWFEWGERLTISKLIRNDNRIQKQYVKDFFDLLNDNIYSYQLFKDTSLLSIELHLTEDGEMTTQDLHAPFWGEGKPVVKNNYADLKEVTYDEGEYKYYKGYFNFTFNDLGLKLAALKYYYEKYFLPLYIRVHEIYMSHHVYSNDIKLINKTSNGITATPVFVSNFVQIEVEEEQEDGTTESTGEIASIKFNNGYDFVYFNRYYKKDDTKDYSEENRLFVDENYNEFSHYTFDFVSGEKSIYYEVNETCLRIPISFPHKKESYEYYDVSLILSRYIDSNKEDLFIDTKDGMKSNLYELVNKSFKFMQTDDRMYEAVILYPKLINDLNENKFDIVYWMNNKFRIDLIVNNEAYSYIFTAKMPEFNIEMGTLEYKYDYESFRQIKHIENDKIEFNAKMYLPNLVTVNNINFNEEIVQMSDRLSEYINKNYKESVKFLNGKYLNICHLLSLCDINGKPIPYDVDEPEGGVMKWEELGMYAAANQNTELYRNFFNDDGTYNFDESVIYINKMKFDLYLMHDYKEWYIMLISKDTDKEISRIPKFKFGDGTKQTKIGNYILKYERTDRKMLLNRFTYRPKDGINHFNKQDIIVVSLKNNDKLAFRLTHGSKWNISPMSLGMNNVNTVTSNTELAIVSIPDRYTEYERGYYSLYVEYSVDDHAQNVFTKKTQFRID